MAATDGTPWPDEPIPDMGVMEIGWLMMMEEILWDASSDMFLEVNATVDNVGEPAVAKKANHCLAGQGDCRTYYSLVDAEE